MDHWTWWRLGADAALFFALVFLTIRFLRAGINSRQILNLETSLKGVIKDAEIAGRSLNEQLGFRQQTLQKLLTDLEIAEGRILKAIDDAEDRKRAIADTMKQVRESARDREPAPAGVAQEYGAPSAAAQPRSAKPARERSADNRPTVQQDGLIYDDDGSPPPTWGKVNIFGEPIAEESLTSTPPAPSPIAAALAERLGGVQTQRTQAATRYQNSERPRAAATPQRESEPKAPSRSLRSSIEREVTPAREVLGGSAGGIEEVYRAAETMLRAGTELGGIGTHGPLADDEAELLSSLVSEPLHPAAPRRPSASGDDAEQSRLGVLGIKRQTVRV